MSQSWVWCHRGARTRACRVETRLDASDPMRVIRCLPECAELFLKAVRASGPERRHEWRRGTHECVRHLRLSPIPQAQEVRDSVHGILPAAQFVTTVMGVTLSASSAVRIRKRWPSAVTS